MKKEPIGIQLPQFTQGALRNGANKFIIPIPEGTIDIQGEDDSYNMIVENYGDMRIENVGLFSSEKLALNYFFNNYSPLQIGDEFYLKEEFCIIDDSFYLSKEDCSFALEDAYSIENCNDSQMTYEQSRFKGKIVNVEVKRTWDIGALDCAKMGIDMKQDIETCEENINKFFEAHNIDFKQNPYVFIYTVKDNK